MDRERLRAANAFSVVSAGGLDKRDRFLVLARELPAMLQTNGLLASWAFLLAKGEEHHLAAARALAAHLRSAGLVAEDAPANPEDLLVDRWLGAGNLAGQSGLSGLELRRLTSEAILYAAWLKRAAEALLSGAEAPQPATGEPGALEVEGAGS